MRSACNSCADPLQEWKKRIYKPHRPLSSNLVADPALLALESMSSMGLHQMSSVHRVALFQHSVEMVFKINIVLKSIAHSHIISNHFGQLPMTHNYTNHFYVVFHLFDSAMKFFSFELILSYSHRLTWVSQTNENRHKQWTLNTEIPIQTNRLIQYAVFTVWHPLKIEAWNN